MGACPAVGGGWHRNFQADPYGLIKQKVPNAQRSSCAIQGYVEQKERIQEKVCIMQIPQLLARKRREVPPKFRTAECRLQTFRELAG